MEVIFTKITKKKLNEKSRKQKSYKQKITSPEKIHQKVHEIRKLHHKSLLL